MGQGSTTYPKRLPTAPLFSRLRMWEEAHEKRVPIRPKPKAPGQGQRQVATVPRGETKGRAPWQAFVRGEESAARGWAAPLGRLIRQGQEPRRGAGPRRGATIENEAAGKMWSSDHSLMLEGLRC